MVIGVGFRCLNPIYKVGDRYKISDRASRHYKSDRGLKQERSHFNWLTNFKKQRGAV